MRRTGWILCGLLFVGCTGTSEPRMYLDAGPIPDVFVPVEDAYLPPMPEQVPIPIDLRCATTLDPVQSVFELAYAPDGSLYARGTFAGEVDLDPGPGTEPFVTPSPSSPQGFVAAFAADCTYRWTRVFDEAITLQGIGVDASGGVVVNGSVAADPFGDAISVDFDPTAGNDRRPAKNVVLVTRLGADGSYVSTATRAWCSPEVAVIGGTCDRPPLLLPNGSAVAPDGTTYVSTDRELIRAAPDGTFGWPSLPPDAGVPAAGPVELGPAGEIWVQRQPALGFELDWSGGIDAPTANCRPGATPCVERAVISRVEPDGTYGGSVVQPPNEIYYVTDFAVDGAGDLQLVGRYQSGTGGSLAPNFDWSGGVERWGGIGFWGSAIGADQTLRFSTVYGVGQTTTATFGQPYGGAISVDGSAGIVYRSGNFTASVGARTGVFFTDDNRYDAFVSAETVDGRPLWSAGIAAPSSPPGPQILLEAGSDGRFALAFAGPDLDITSGTLAPPHAGTSIAVYEPERCTDGETRPTVCTGAGPATLTCTGARWGPSTCDEAAFDMARVCMVTCEQLSSHALACGSHDDGCGGTISCGTCAAPMICGGTERTCRGPSGSSAIARGLNHAGRQMALDATHVYFVVAGNLPHLSLPGDVTIMRAPRDGSGPAETIATAGPDVMFAVSDTHLYATEAAAGTFWRIAKDGTGARQTIANDLWSPSGPVVDGSDYVYYTTARQTPIHVFELRQYQVFADYTGVADSMGDTITAAFVDDTYVWATSVLYAGMYRWPRGEVGVPVPELVPSPPPEVALRRTSRGVVDASGGEWTFDPGERRRRTWTGRILHDGAPAYTGLNHVIGLVGDAAGLFAAIEGDYTVTTDTGEILRVW